MRPAVATTPAKLPEMALDERAGSPAASFSMRVATPPDLETCAAIWRAATNDYMRRLNLLEIPDDLGPILRLYRHLLAVDRDSFVVAEQSGAGKASQIVAFVSAVRREALWFLSMLFVLPGAQGAGLGRALLSQVLPTEPDVALATCTDSAQPISNALYGSLGIVPRMPLFRLVGLVDRASELTPLPSGIRPVPFDDIIGGVGGLGIRALDDELDGLDRAAIGIQHRIDHDFVRAEGRAGFLYCGPDGRPLGYGYASEAGRVGPVAVADPELLPAVVAHLVTTVAARGAYGIWLPGGGAAMPGLLRAGFRIDGFPVLLCWDRPFAQFDRYIPISPGLL